MTMQPICKTSPTRSPSVRPSRRRTRVRATLSLPAAGLACCLSAAAPAQAEQGPWLRPSNSERCRSPGVRESRPGVGGLAHNWHHMQIDKMR